MKAIKLLVAAACIVGAVLFSMRSAGSDEEIPDGPDSSLTWMCKSCKSNFSLTDKQFIAAEQLVSKKHDRSFGPLTCTKCKQVDAWRANKCLTHDLWYFVNGVSDAPGGCPECTAKRAEQSSSGDDDTSAKKDAPPVF